MTTPWHRQRSQMRRLSILVLTLLAGSLTGCASGMSDNARRQVTFQGTFQELQRTPEAHRGEVVMLGGRIVETSPLAEGTEVVVLQLPLSASDKPNLDGASEGRFLVSSQEFIDPAVYQKLTPVTVVGEITGHTVRTIGAYAYTLPVLRPIEIKAWSAQYGGRSSPAVHLGVGAGSHGGGAGFGISF